MSDLNDFNDLMSALRYNKSYDKFHNEYKKEINDSIESLNAIIQKSFGEGYESGRDTGLSEGIRETKMKMLFRLVEMTALSDEDILYILEKEGDYIYIQKLKELRGA